MNDDRHIIVFDGVCKFCNGAVNFIIRRDPNKMFRFAPMQSEAGQRLIEKYNADMVGVDTFLLIKNGVCFERTDAALEIAKDLSGLWPLCRAFRVLPRSFRDFFYRKLAVNRYQLFGRFDECMVPTPEIRDRFIDSE